MQDKCLFAWSIRSHYNGLLISVGPYRFPEKQFEILSKHVLENGSVAPVPHWDKEIVVGVEGSTVKLGDHSMPVISFQNLVDEFHKQRGGTS